MKIGRGVGAPPSVGISEILRTEALASATARRARASAAVSRSTAVAGAAPVEHAPVLASYAPPAGATTLNHLRLRAVASVLADSGRQDDPVFREALSVIQGLMDAIDVIDNQRMVSAPRPRPRRPARGRR